MRKSTAVAAAFLTAIMTMNPAHAAPARQPTIDRFTPVFPVDYSQCIESCDRFYSDCIKRGNTNQYCSGQHDTCRRGCLRDR